MMAPDRRSSSVFASALASILASVAVVAHHIASGLSALWRRARTHEDRRFHSAVATALCLHLFTVLFLTGALDVDFGELLGLPEPARTSLGDAKGVIDGVNVETIDAAEYDRRYVSFNAGRDAIDTEPVEAQPSPAQPPQTPKAEPQKAEPQKAEPQKAELPPEKESAAESSLLPPEKSPQIPAELSVSEKPTPPEQPPQEKPDRQKPAESKLTAADIAEIMEMSRLDVVTTLTSKASTANLGEASEFVRAVLRKLKLNMPNSKGIRGQVVIGLLVSITGEIEQIAVLKSSSKPELDRLVVDSIRATRLVAPTKTTPMRERTFQITYEYN